LARQPELSADIRNRLVDKARGLGFPVDDLILVDHAKPDCGPGQSPAK
jgi:apolipoprotein D and lipocalin family protein